MSDASSSSAAPKKGRLTAKDLLKCGVIARAAKKLPKSEVDYVFNHFKDLPDGDKQPSEDELRAGLVNNRLSVPVCNFCSKKGGSTYILCAACEMTWYCDHNCQEKDAGTHEKWCCQPLGPRDMGPMATVFTKLPDSVAKALGPPGTIVKISKGS